jgi:hypothetical protein
MTMRVVIARPRPGIVRETRRVAHLFEISAGHDVPETLTALCGDEFGHGQLELLERPSGMPCEYCLRRSPTSYPELPATCASE